MGTISLVSLVVLTTGDIRQVQGPATLTLSTPREPIQLSDLVMVTIEVALNEGWDIEVPTSLTRSPLWRGRKESPVQLTGPADGQRTWRQTFWLEPLSLGELPLAFESWKIRQKDGKTRDIAWEAVTIKVDGVLGEVSVEKARDITPIEELPAPPPRGFDAWHWFAVGLAAALIAGGAGVWCWRRRPAPPARLTPRERALRRIHRLEKRLRADSIVYGAFVRLLTYICRAYLQRCYPLPARRLNRGELIARLQADNLLPAPIIERLDRWLDRCDQIRFARVETGRAECEASARELAAMIGENATASAVAEAPVSGP